MTAWMRSLLYALARSLPLARRQGRNWHGQLTTLRSAWMRVPHGSAHTFANGCRCSLCLTAHRLGERRKRAERRSRGLCGACGVRPSGKRYRCPPCAEDHAAWEQVRRDGGRLDRGDP